MKFTQAEISDDGNMIRATLSPETDKYDRGPAEIYHVWWEGSGKLGSINQDMAEVVTEKTYTR